MKNPYSQKAIAKYLGVSARTVGRWDRCEIPMPFEMAVRVAEYMGVDVAEIYAPPPPKTLMKAWLAPLPKGKN